MKIVSVLNFNLTNTMEVYEEFQILVDGITVLFVHVSLYVIYTLYIM